METQTTKNFPGRGSRPLNRFLIVGNIKLGTITPRHNEEKNI